MESTNFLFSSFKPLLLPKTFFKRFNADLWDLFLKLSTKDWRTITCCCHSDIIDWSMLFSKAKLYILSTCALTSYRFVNLSSVNDSLRLTVLSQKLSSDHFLSRSNLAYKRPERIQESCNTTYMIAIKIELKRTSIKYESFWEGSLKQLKKWSKLSTDTIFTACPAW